MDNTAAVATDRFAPALRIIESHGKDRSKLIPILQAVQEAYRYLPEDVLAFIAGTLDISPARVYGVVTFFSHFTMEPKGKHVLKVCDGTACHVRGSSGLIDAIRAALKLEEGNSTTADMLFTLETVSCLGACGLAPVMLVNDTVHAQMTPAKVVELVAGIRAAEKGGTHGSAH